MLVVYGFLATTTGLWILQFLVNHIYKHFSPELRSSMPPRQSPEACRAYMKKSCLESRALPNKRLTRAFNIENSFTTTDAEYHASYKKSAEMLLNLGKSEWVQLAKDTTALVQKSITKDKINLAHFVQTVVLKTVLQNLFPDSGFSNLSQEEQEEPITTVARLINSLWLSSKDQEISNPEDLPTLIEACRKLLPNVPFNPPRENPLNLILPAYETLWRIVFRCFIQVQFRSKQDTPVYKCALVGYLLDPTYERFDKIDIVSASNIVNESLRLYPPTRRIFRQILPQTDANEGNRFAANVEYYQHDPAIWGADVEAFEPKRWHKDQLTKEQISAFMPFGCTPFVCPAKKIWGPMIIGILAAALVTGFGEEWDWEATTKEDRIDGDGSMENRRDSYKTLTIVKVSNAKGRAAGN